MINLNQIAKHVFCHFSNNLDFWHLPYADRKKYKSELLEKTKDALEHDKMCSLLVYVFMLMYVTGTDINFIRIEPKVES